MIIPEHIRALAERLRTQDNRCTAAPVFLVQKIVRDLSDDDHDHDGVAFFCRERADTINADHWERVEQAYQMGDNVVHVDDSRYVIDKLDRYCFKNRWETVTTCLTEDGAKAYLECNGHNIRSYGAPRIYAESLYRNHEMIALREWLMTLVPA